MDNKPTNGTINQVPTKPSVTVDEDLNKPYVDTRSVIIATSGAMSNFRRANSSFYGAQKQVIGSSITSANMLASNKDEVQAYFTQLLGISSNDPSFNSRVKSYLNNIHLVIEDEKRLDISFRYTTKQDYLNFKAKEESIEAEFNKVNRANIDEIRKGIKIKVESLNRLESEKYAYGSPINLPEYIIYRHCLLYRDVAKDKSLINADGCRFFIKDEAREAEQAKKFVDNQKKAMINFAELGANKAKREAVIIAIAINKNEVINNILTANASEQDKYLMEFVYNNPEKFNKFFNDPKIGDKAFIEKLIMNGELIRSEFNQQIMMADGTFIGANMNEALAYFANPANNGVKTQFENKLKNL